MNTLATSSAYKAAYEAAQAGGMNNTDSHEFALDQARRHYASVNAATKNHMNTPTKPQERPAMEIARSIWPGSAKLADAGKVEHSRDLECLAQVIEDKMQWNEHIAHLEMEQEMERMNAVLNSALTWEDLPMLVRQKITHVSNHIEKALANLAAVRQQKGSR